MQALQRFIERHLHKLMMLFLAAGFAMVLAELLLDGHTDGIQRVGVLAAGLGLLLGLIALFAQGALRYVLVVLFLLLSISGLVGAYEHYEERGEEAAKPAEIVAVPANRQTISLRTVEIQQEEEGEAEKATPPPLAPFSLSGLSLMAAVMLLGTKEELG